MTNHKDLKSILSKIYFLVIKCTLGKKLFLKYRPNIETELDYSSCVIQFELLHYFGMSMSFSHFKFNSLD